MVIIGILNTRKNLSIEIFTNNIIFGPLAYLFLGLSGFFIIKILQIRENSSYNGKISINHLIIIFGIVFLIGFSLSMTNMYINLKIFNLNILIITLAAFIGVLWLSLGNYAFKTKKNSKIIKRIITSLSFSIGIIYGAILNDFLIPIFILFFFLSASLLQLSRELIKDLNPNDNSKEVQAFLNRNNTYKALKSSLILQILAILFFFLPCFTNIDYIILFLFLITTGIFFIGIASVLTFKSLLKKEVNRKISLFLKIGVFIEIITFLLVGS